MYWKAVHPVAHRTDRRLEKQAQKSSRNAGLRQQKYSGGPPQWASTPQCPFLLDTAAVPRSLTPPTSGVVFIFLDGQSHTLPGDFKLRAGDLAWPGRSPACLSVSLEGKEGIAHVSLAVLVGGGFLHTVHTPPHPASPRVLDPG